MEFRSIILVFCLICSTIAVEEIDDDRKNPIINLFNAPLRAFKTEPGEAIAVFEPELLRQANNDTNGISSWFQAGQNIGSAAGALTGWIRNRISSTTTTTSQPEVIVQVHQVERPKPDDIHLDGIRLGPNNNIAKRKQQQQSLADDLDELDRIEDELNNNNNNNNNNKNNNKNNNNNNNDDDDEDDGNNSNEDDDFQQVNNNRINPNKIRRNRNRNRIEKKNNYRGGSRNRNFNNNFRYEYEDDTEEEYDDDDDDSYRDDNITDYDDDDDDDSNEGGYHNYVHSDAYSGNVGHRRQHPVGNYNRIQQNRRPVQQFNNAIRPPKRNSQQNDFYRPFQDIPPLAKPIRYGVNNNNNNNFQPQAIGVLKQKQMIQRRKQQQLLQQQKLEQQQLEQQQQQQQLQQQQQQQLQQQQQILTQQQQIRPQQQNRPQQLDLLLNNQQHVLIPVQFIPSSVPYTQILPQIQVVAQHHHTIEPQSTETESPITEKPNRRRRPNRRRPEQNFDDNQRPASRKTTTMTTRRTITTRKPTRTTTQRTTRRTTTTTMPPKKPEKGNKFEINRRKPSTALRSDTPAAKPDENRPDATPPLQTDEQISEEKEEEQMPLYKPPELITEQDMSDENIEDAVDEEAEEIEPKSGEGRAQYYLPQSYYKILGSNSYLALNNNGRFLLRTGRKSDLDPKDTIKLPDNDKINITESTTEEKLVTADKILAKPIVDVPIKVIDLENKTEIDDTKLLPVLPVTQIKSDVEELKKDVKENDKEIQIKTKEVLEKENEDKTLKVTPSPLKVEEKKPIVIKKEHLVPLETIIKPTEKIILRSEVVQEKQNGNFIIKSENAATSPKVDSISIEKINKTDTTKETS